MKVLISGASGMVGKNIHERCLQNNIEVIAARSSEVNLLDRDAVFCWIQSQRPDVVIHCAGVVGGIQANIAEPVRFFSANMRMALNIIEAARESGVLRLVNMGSSCMYPWNANNPLREEMVLKGELEPTNEGYAIAKVAAARLCDYISREDKRWHYKTLIPCNLYGRYDKFDPRMSHMIPAVIRKIHIAKKLNASEVEIWGDGTARREFMYAGDLADFVVRSLEKLEELPQLLNVGLGHDYTINEYYGHIAAVVGYGGGFVHDLSKPVGMKQKLVDISRLQAFGWSASTSLKEGIEQTYRYFLETQL